MSEEIITIECSVCEQQFTDKICDMWQRTDRHDMRHVRKNIKDERHPKLDAKQYHPMGGLIYKKNYWITISD